MDALAIRYIKLAGNYYDHNCRLIIDKRITVQYVQLSI